MGCKTSVDTRHYWDNLLENNDDRAASEGEVAHLQHKSYKVQQRGKYLQERLVKEQWNAGASPPLKHVQRLKQQPNVVSAGGIANILEDSALDS